MHLDVIEAKIASFKLKKNIYWLWTFLANLNKKYIYTGLHNTDETIIDFS